MLGNTLGTWGTYWKLDGNIMGTKEKWEKKNPSVNNTPPLQKLKKN